MKGIIIEGKLKYLKQFKSWRDSNGNLILGVANASEEQLSSWGFLDIEEAVLSSNQIIGNPYVDELSKTIKFEIINLEVAEETEADKLELKKGLDKLKINKGVLIGDMWFNEFYLGNFINLISLAINIGLKTIEWRNKDNEWIEFSIDEANELALRAMIGVKNIYKSL